MAILGSDEGDGSDMGGITGGVRGVAGRAEGVTSGISSVEAPMSTSISTSCGSTSCCGCGISGCSALAGPPGSALYVVIFVQFLRVNISRHMRLRLS